MSDPRPATAKRVASVSGDDATYYVEEHESGWRVTYDDAPIGILKDAGDATRFACDIENASSDWSSDLGHCSAELEEVHRFETRAGSIKPPIEHEGGRLVRARPTQWDRVLEF